MRAFGYDISPRTENIKTAVTVIAVVLAIIGICFAFGYAWMIVLSGGDFVQELSTLDWDKPADEQPHAYGVFELVAAGVFALMMLFFGVLGLLVVGPAFVDVEKIDNGDQEVAD